MSIEKDLQDLTASVRELTRLLDLVILNAEQREERAAMRDQDKPNKQRHPDPVIPPEGDPALDTAPAVEPVATISKKDLMDWALSQVRQNPAFKETLVEVLKDYGVKTINKLKDEDVTAVYSALGGGR